MEYNKPYYTLETIEPYNTVEDTKNMREEDFASNENKVCICLLYSP